MITTLATRINLAFGFISWLALFIWNGMITCIKYLVYDRRHYGMRSDGSKYEGGIKIDRLRSKIHTRNFSYTSIKQLLINSNYENIVFDNGKSTLMLEALDSVEEINDSYGDFVEDDGAFFNKLSKVLSKLDSGKYKFDFYFYIESYSLTNVFKFDSNNKYLLKEENGKTGYLKYISFRIKLDSNRERKLLFIASELSEAICWDNKWASFNLRLDKETILVVNKINDTQASNDSGIKKTNEITTKK